MAQDKKVIRKEISDFLSFHDTDPDVRTCLIEVITSRPGNLQYASQSRTYCMSSRQCILQENNPKGGMPYCNKGSIYVSYM